MAIYSVKVPRTRPASIAASVAPGADGKLNGRFEIQNVDPLSIQLGHRPDFAWGDGIVVEKKPAGADTGGAYSQEVNPDPIEWWALADPAGAVGTFADVRIIDTRSPSIALAGQTVVRIEGA